MGERISETKAEDPVWMTLAAPKHKRKASEAELGQCRLPIRISELSKDMILQLINSTAKQLDPREAPSKAF